MTELKITVPVIEQSSYPITIGTEILSSLWPLIEQQFPNHSKVIITDENRVTAGHLKKLSGDRETPTFVINPPGETSKNINTVISIIEEMEKCALGRDTVVIALGGGTVGDIAGFAAAIFKRGIQVIQIPTTTVAQADSAIGGKTGVDSSLSKNAFGSFWHPAGVYIDVATLKTLDERQYRAGLVESVKHALIANSEYFEFLEENIDSILSRDTDVLETMAIHNCKIKGSVVELDPLEKNQRRMLNYGHTLGHAIEQASGFELLHGEAIAIGIIGAGLIEIETGLGTTDRLKRIQTIFEKIDISTAIPENLEEKKLVKLIKHDKKAVQQWPRFVLIDKIGHVHLKDGQYALEVEREIVEKIIKKLKNR
ncbi:MAG: 3-dehydroquinate synthase [Planctomycetota bacterium]|jgi:3-dehydroquinate synthase